MGVLLLGSLSTEKHERIHINGLSWIDAGMPNNSSFNQIINVNILQSAGHSLAALLDLLAVGQASWD